MHVRPAGQRAEAVAPDPFAIVRFIVRTAFLGLFAVALGPMSLRGQSGPAEPVRLRAGDAIRLEVRDEPQLGGEYLVDQNQQALLPLIGLVRVGGRPFDEVRADVAAAYRQELAHGDVRVTPLIRIAVLGEVRQPGLYPVDPTYTLADVLASAGGLGPAADPSKIEIVRDGRVYQALSEADAAALAQTLRSGDQVVVARRGWFSNNSVQLIGATLSLVVGVATALILR